MSSSLTLKYDISRINELQNTVEILTHDGKITANRCFLRAASSVIHDNCLKNPDLTVLDLKNHKKAAVDNLLHLVYHGKATLNDEVEKQEVINLAQDLDVNISYVTLAMPGKSIKVDAPEVPEDEPKTDDPGLIELPDGRFGCGICFKDFGRKSDAKRHYQNIHMAKENNISCRIPECDKKFSNMKYMKEHMTKKHGIPGAMISPISKAKSAKSVKKSIKKVVKEEPIED